MCCGRLTRLTRERFREPRKEHPDAHVKKKVTAKKPWQKKK